MRLGSFIIALRGKDFRLFGVCVCVCMRGTRFYASRISDLSFDFVKTKTKRLDSKLAICGKAGEDIGLYTISNPEKSLVARLDNVDDARHSDLKMSGLPCNCRRVFVTFRTDVLFVGSVGAISRDIPRA